MGTKTIGLKDDAYERLKARKRDDESFTDLVNRLLDEATTDWRAGFGTLSDGEADELEDHVERTREQASQGLATRQQEAIQELANTESNDETA